jgi:hypothetical protein
MSKTPTFAPASVLARPCASWSIAFVPSPALSALPAVPASRTWQIDAEDFGVGGHMYTNHGTTGSKRPNPGHLDEVST